MNAIRYIVETCIVDAEGDVHVILTNEKRGAFIPLYLGFEQSESLVDHFNGNPSEEDTLSWSFVMSTWVKLGFQPVSVIIDHQGANGYMVPVMTFLQNQLNQNYIYVSCLIPMGAAILASSILNIPMYLTERAESMVKRIDLSKLNDYIEEVSVLEYEPDGEQE